MSDAVEVELCLESPERAERGGSDLRSARRNSASMAGPQPEDRLRTLQVYRLLQAVHQGDQEQVTKMAAVGVGGLLNLQEPRDGTAALHLAAAGNDLEMLSFLMSLGSRPDPQDHRGRTPAMLAAEQGHDPALTLLAQNHADMNLLDAEGKESLQGSGSLGLCSGRVSSGLWVSGSLLGPSIFRALGLWVSARAGSLQGSGSLGLCSGRVSGSLLGPGLLRALGLCLGQVSSGLWVSGSLLGPGLFRALGLCGPGLFRALGLWVSARAGSPQGSGSLLGPGLFRALGLWVSARAGSLQGSGSLRAGSLQGSGSLGLCSGRVSSGLWVSGSLLGPGLLRALGLWGARSL
ncbi:unnamed protein product [Arctogadus glacialis]